MAGLQSVAGTSFPRPCTQGGKSFHGRGQWSVCVCVCVWLRSCRGRVASLEHHSFLGVDHASPDHFTSVRGSLLSDGLALLSRASEL